MTILKFWHALTSQAEDLSVLSLGGNPQHNPAIQMGNLYFAAKDSGKQRDIKPYSQIIPFAFKLRMRQHVGDEIEIPGRTSSRTGPALACQAHP